ncbi:hypothetical protein [Tersicoccus sp. Bi-70]|uniref:hypothetical protein n=1 Tax=Tersicoccus sp. Bi-70 TaxID=1897634 RepID=UPI001301299B|nr:hypothetical protein [Tersicoccus sp. Bi-70]
MLELSHPRLRRAGRRAVAFVVPYAVTMSLIPRLGLEWAVLVGLLVFGVVTSVLHVTARPEAPSGAFSRLG